MPPTWPGAFFLTDPKRVPDPLAIVPTLPPGTGVIYRHFGAHDREAVARKLRRATLQTGAPFLTANDPELAMTVKADGVHWPEAEAHKARKWRGRFFFQTQSAHSPKALREAVCDGVLFSTVFPSRSPSAGRAIGAIRFRQLANAANLKIYALGGASGATAGQVTQSGGFAAIDGFI